VRRRSPLISQSVFGAQDMSALGHSLPTPTCPTPLDDCKPLIADMIYSSPAHARCPQKQTEEYDHV